MELRYSYAEFGWWGDLPNIARKIEDYELNFVIYVGYCTTQLCSLQFPDLLKITLLCLSI